MADTINELSSLSRELNESSDRINKIITDINKKIAALNLGVEVWLEDDPLCVSNQNPFGEPIYSQQAVTYLGFYRWKDEWQLMTKSGYREEISKTGEAAMSNQAFGEPIYSQLIDVRQRPLLETSREVRSAAMALVPKLLDVMKQKAEDLLKSIEAADLAARKL